MSTSLVYAAYIVAAILFILAWRAVPARAPSTATSSASPVWRSPRRTIILAITGVYYRAPEA